MSVNNNTITFRFWRVNSWPTSINKIVQGDTMLMCFMEVPLDETFERDGETYYSMKCGHGTDVELLVEYDICPICHEKMTKDGDISCIVCDRDICFSCAISDDHSWFCPEHEGYQRVVTWKAP